MKWKGKYTLNREGYVALAGVWCYTTSQHDAFILYSFVVIEELHQVVMFMCCSLNVMFFYMFFLM